jgi:hypothetical protein
MPGLAAITHAPRRASVTPAPEVLPDTKSRRRPGLPLFLQRRPASGGGAASLPGRSEGLIDEDEEHAEIQTKLIVSQPGDEYEQEADRVAEQVMRMTEPRPQRTDISGGPGLKQTKPLPVSINPKTQRQKGQDDEDNPIQAKPPGSLAEGVPARTDLETQIERNKGRGDPLPETVLLNMATRFGVDFSDVQVHTGDDAQQMNRALGAEAFTQGSDIYFGDGHRPTNSELTAHELTHVIQQTGGLPRPTNRQAEATSVNPSPAIQPTPAPGVAVAPPRQAPAPKAIPGAAEKKPPPGQSLGEAKPSLDAEKALAPEGKKESEIPAASNEGKAKGTTPETTAGKEIPPAPPTPETDPSFQKARKQVRVEAEKQKTHDPKDKKRREVEDAALLSKDDQIAQSGEVKRSEELEQVGAKQQQKVQKFDAESFKVAFRNLVNTQAPPKNEDAVKEYSTKQPLEKFPEDLSHGIAEKQGEVTGPLEAKYKETLKGTAVEAKEVPPAKSPAAPASVDPRLAIAKPVPEEQLSQQHESDRLDGAMEKNRLDDDQLAESREPSFVETLKVKQEAKQKLAEAPGVYRQQEATILGGAEAQTQQLLATRLGGMHGISHRAGAHVFKDQKSTESTTEKRQAEIKKPIHGFYESTVTGVQAVLAEMTTRVKEQFANGLKFQSDEFNRRVRKRVSDYYGKYRIDDKLFGPADVVVKDDGSTRPMTFREAFGGGGEIETINPDVYEIFVQEKKAFITAMGEELARVADIVVTRLNAAQSLIELGKTNIAIFKATLQGEELRYATQLEEEVRLKFENLEGSIADAQQDLLQTMADQYTEQVTQLKKTFTDINDELKKSWIDRAIEFIETVGKTIFELADLLLSILVRMAHLIWDIIKHPIRFFETLVSGLMQGIGEFIGNIGTYLQEAFWTWITGATPVKSISLSAASGVRALFDLVLQVLSLGPSDLRAIVEKVLGKEFMEMVDKGVAFAEKALEPVTILLTKGPVAFWDYLVDSLENVIESAFDRIKESVFFAFVEKGLKWIAGFFIPGGGFVKIVKAIVAAFQFVASNLDKIRQFFDSVFDSMEDAVAGNPSGVASKIVKGLTSGVVLALDFLARQLGLENLVDSVQKILQSIRRPIVSAIEWVLQKIKPFVTKIMRTLGLGKKETSEGARPAGAREVGEPVPFLEGRTQHHLFVQVTGASATVMLASAPRPLKAVLSQMEEKISTLAPESQSTASSLIERAHNLLSKTDKEADQVAADLAAPGTANAGTGAPVNDKTSVNDRVKSDEHLLADTLGEIFTLLGGTTGLPFSKPVNMADAGHTLTVKEEGGHLEVWLASRPDAVRAKFAEVDRILKRWEDYIDNLANPAIKEEFTLLIKPEIDAKKTTALTAAAARAEKIKSKDFGTLKGEIDTTIAALASEISAWATAAGLAVNDFSDAAVAAALARQAEEAAERVWLGLQARTQQLLEGFAGQIQALDPDARLRYRGSLAKFRRGVTKAFGEFNPLDFDVDLFIQSDLLFLQAAGGRPGRGEVPAENHPAVAPIMGDMRTAYKQIPGVRPGSFSLVLRSVANVRSLIALSGTHEYAGETHVTITPPAPAAPPAEP